MINDQRSKRIRIIWTAAFIIYLMILFYLTVYRRRFDLSIFTSGELFKNGKLFLVPFVHMKWAYSDYPPYFITSLLENLIMFVPVGICLRKIFGERMTVGKIILTAFLLSLSIEFLQYMFGTGESETDDLIINTFSAFMGAEVCIITEKYKNKVKNNESKG